MCSAPVTALNLEGYGLAFAAVCWYNYTKLQAMTTGKEAQPEVGGIETSEITEHCACPGQVVAGVLA